MREREKIYKTMTGVGTINITLGIITLVSGLACGILMLISGARLLKRKNSIVY